MHSRKRRARALTLTSVILLSLLVMACGSAKQAAQSPVETTAPEVEATEPPEAAETTAPEVEATETPEAEASEGEAGTVENTVDNLSKLAPVHLVSQFEAKTGDEVTSKARLEADVDAKGNQHLKLYDQSDTVTELYIVGKTMYVGAGEGQFAAMGEVEDDARFSILAIYGGAYFLAYNNLEDAKKVGSESVNGFQADKYEIKYDLASLGLGGLAADVQGADWTYQGYAWVDPGTGALVRARVDWSGKSADSDATETFHSEFDATKADLEEITAPENLLGASQ